jgi:hypothetical protein
MIKLRIKQQKDIEMNYDVAKQRGNLALIEHTNKTNLQEEENSYIPNRKKEILKREFERAHENAKAFKEMQDKLNKIEQINLNNVCKRNLNNIDFTKTQFHVISHDRDEMNKRLDDAMSRAKKVEEETKNRLLKEEEKIKINK